MKRRYVDTVLAEVDAGQIIEEPEPLITDARRGRLRQVLDRRLQSVTVVMDAPHNQHNGAAVMRSCDAFGVFRMHVVERHEPFAAASSVAKGAERWVEVVTHRQVSDAVAAVRQSGHVLVGTHPEGELIPHQLASIERLALVMGNEHDGIRQQLSDACSAYVQIPMRGFVESLNVSVSAAILLSYATSARAGDLPAEQRRRLYARYLLQSVTRAPEVLRDRGLLAQGAEGFSS